MFNTLRITTTSANARADIHSFASELLSHGENAGVVFEALAADPDCAIAQAYAGALFLTKLTRDGNAQAASHLAAAQALAHYASPREQQVIAAIMAWGNRREMCAIRLLRGVVEAWPHDLVAAKFCQILELGTGDITGMVRTSAMAASVDDRSGFALGLHAFALEQAGDARLAGRFGRRAIEANPDRDPWAQHAVAHALAARGMPAEGRAFLCGHAPDWNRCSSFMLTHNWWHLALFELELNGADAALELYDSCVWGVRKNHAQDQINAVSLLSRLELCGVDAGDRWDDLAFHIAPRAEDGINGFLDLHYVQALARAGYDRATETMLRRLAGGECITSAVARGVVAHARGRYFDAVAALSPVRSQLGLIGGSNIQRETFALIFADSLMRARLVNDRPLFTPEYAAERRYA